MSAIPQPSMYIESILPQVLRMKNAVPQLKHGNSLQNGLWPFFWLLLIIGNEVPGISKLSDKI